MILLLDERFSRRQYREIFPREWQKLQNVQCEHTEKSHGRILEIAQEFACRPGKREMFVVSDCELAFRKFLADVEREYAVILFRTVIHSGDAVIRNKSDTESDPREVDKKVIARKLDFRGGGGGTRSS